MLSDLDIKNRIIEPTKGRSTGKTNVVIGDKSEMIPRSSIKEIIEQIPLLTSNPSLINSKFNRDLMLLEIIDNHNELTEHGKYLVSIDELNQRLLLKDKILTLPKMKSIQDYMNKQAKTTSKDLIGQFPSNFFDGEKESSKIIYATKAMTWLK